ncbi:MAG: hypothetical protein ACR2JB_13425 [Bryobacteraceae bacterium]
MDYQIRAGNDLNIPKRLECHFRNYLVEMFARYLAYSHDCASLYRYGQAVFTTVQTHLVDFPRQVLYSATQRLAPSYRWGAAQYSYSRLRHPEPALRLV